jgi:uncharacterized glyoxalase superfamily protein PhnB
MESLSPNLFVHNITRSIDFYTDLGFSVIMTVPEKGDPDWAMLTCGKVTIMIQTYKSLGEELPEIQRKPTGGSLLFYINIKQIRSFFARIESKVTVVKGINITFYGATEFTIKDLDGYVLTFAEDE